MTDFPIAPSAVRYIKLGPGGRWEEDARQKGILRLGFESADPESMAMCREGRWADLRKAWQDARGNATVGTRDMGEIRSVFSDQGDTLWVTFIGDELHWGFLEPGELEPYAPSDANDLTTFRRVKGGWRSTDADGKPISKTSLPGVITRVTGYQGTTCEVSASDRLVARINAQRTPAIERVENAQRALLEAALPLIKDLHWKEFEVLIDMLFTSAGWRRVGVAGKNEKTKDLDLEMPLTKEKAFVQIKSSTNQADLDSYTEKLDEMNGYSRMFFVYHSSNQRLVSRREDVSVLGPDDVARLVIELGFIDWVVDKAK